MRAVNDGGHLSLLVFVWFYFKKYLFFSPLRIPPFSLPLFLFFISFMVFFNFGFDGSARDSLELKEDFLTCQAFVKLAMHPQSYTTSLSPSMVNYNYEK